MKFPTCPEVCRECSSGQHILHVMGQLGDLWAEKKIVCGINDGKKYSRIMFGGTVQDELGLEDLLDVITFIVNREKGQP